MADATTIKWLYPPNFTGTFDEATRDKAIGPRRYSVLFTNYSDGTGETEELKVKRNDLRTTEGEVPSRLVIEKIDYNIVGMTVRISTNNDNEEEIVLQGDGVVDYTKIGGWVPIDAIDDVGGDIIFNTEGASAGDSYTIQLNLRVKQ